MSKGEEKTPAQNQAHSAGELYGPTSEVTRKHICMTNEIIDKRRFFTFLAVILLIALWVIVREAKGANDGVKIMGNDLFWRHKRGVQPCFQKAHQKPYLSAKNKPQSSGQNNQQDSQQE